MSSTSGRPPSEPAAWSHPPPASERETYVFSNYALRGGNTDLQLPEGETTVGRSLDCGVVIDSPVVSRRHAVLVVRGDDIFVRDTGSRNGLLLNGEELRGEAKLKEGDRFTVGGITFELIHRQAGSLDRERQSTVPPLVLAEGAQSDESASHDTSRVSAFDLLGSVADKALALGSIEEVVRLLGKHINLTHKSVRLGNPIAPEQVLAASSYAIRIAIAAKDASWAVMALEMLCAERLIPSADRIDQLYSLVNLLRPHHPLVQTYAKAIGEIREELSPKDRFALKRLNGLERLIALKA